MRHRGGNLGARDTQNTELIHLDVRDSTLDYHNYSSYLHAKKSLLHTDLKSIV